MVGRARTAWQRRAVWLASIMTLAHGAIASAQPEVDGADEETRPPPEKPARGTAGASPAGGGNVVAGEPQATTDEPPERAPLKGRFEVTARGVLSFNLAWSDATLVPGAYVLYAARPASTGSQFVLSPANTVLGFSIEGVSFRGASVVGAVDFALKSPAPAQRSILSPLFYDVHIGVRGRRSYLVVGQFPDVVFPFVAASLNGYPGSYVAGSLGFYRPQIRAGAIVDLTSALDVRLQASVGQDVQNFRITPLTGGGGADVPDLQGRLSIAAGAPTPGARNPWKRQYELGAAGHIGKRRFAFLEMDVPTQIVARTTWSIVGDARAELPSGTTLRGRLWMGRVLGDYQGGIFQSVAFETLEAIGARGGWIDVQQRVARAWRVAIGYGRDDPEDESLSPGQRQLNETAFGNLRWQWSAAVSFGAEISYWSTEWKGLADVDTTRGELNLAVTF